MYNELMHGIENIIYGGSALHKHIIEKTNTSQRIGLHGENLTIMVLSMNRSSSTIRLMQSINDYMPKFAGTFLIVDNGSEPSEKANLINAFDRMTYRCEMLEFDKNFGVAGGRNRGASHVNTDWILSLDNDIYFVGNPMHKITNDLDVLGCHFLNLPLLDETKTKVFANGGHLYFDTIDSQLVVGAGSMFQQSEIIPNVTYSPSIGTFLFGGASIFKKSTFLDCGGFDEGMFVGFEDLDFSMSLFNAGYKIGNCGVASLVHDHPKPQHKTDIDYEKKRFSKSKLVESAEYFNQKNNIKVWTDITERWLEDKHSSLGISDSSKASAEPLVTELPKIALFIDARGWAFDNISTQLEIHLREQFQFIKIYMSDWDNIASALFASKDCDILHFFWRPHVDLIESDYCRQYIEAIGGQFDDFLNQYVKGKIVSTCVYDHLLRDEKHIDLSMRALSRADRYYVASNKLNDIYTEDCRFKNPTTVCPDGVNLDLFVPKNLERFENMDRTVRIGWVGNSKWDSNESVVDLKGIHTIIRPCVDLLKAEGYDVELITSDRQEKLIPHKDMPDFYNSIDLYICASAFEGTPNPVLESMACGIPIVSTDVGIVRDAFGQKQSAFILKTRSVDELTNKVRELLDNKALFAELSQENLDHIQKWNWKQMTDNFKFYFNTCLNK